MTVCERTLTYLPIYFPFYIEDVEEHFDPGQFSSECEGGEVLDIDHGEVGPGLVRHVKGLLGKSCN